MLRRSMLLIGGCLLSRFEQSTGRIKRKSLSVHAGAADLGFTPGANPVIIWTQSHIFLEINEVCSWE